jgi:hypothetical protein
MTGEMRWWSIDELDASRDAFAPRELRRHLRELLRSGPPADPIDVGV